MTKRSILILIPALIGLSGCGNKPADPSKEPEEPTPCVHVDLNHDGECDLCHEEVEVHHVDNNNNHKCDVCEYVMSSCEDLNHDHKCDLCDKAVSTCDDLNHDHKCDTCDKVLSVCQDLNSDHKCDTCEKVLSQCEDLNYDHNCDVCGNKISSCIDSNKDHLCDICALKLGDCVDSNKDHKCDVCGKTLSECADLNKDHNCDYCGEVLSAHADNDKDHNCDYCGEKVSEHNYVNGYCTICEERDPDFNLYYLPSYLSVYNSAFEDYQDKFTFKYDEDLLGYNVTRTSFGFDDINVKTYRYSADYSELTITDEDVLDGVVDSSSSKNIYHYLEGSSYSVDRYYYNVDLEAYVYNDTKTRIYNEDNRKVLEKRKCYDDDLKCYIYDEYETFEYDEAGFIIKDTDYEAFLVDEEPTNVYIYTTYTYNQDHTTCIEETYFKGDKGFKRDGYTLKNIKEENGIIYFDEQIYYEDGELGNHNKFEYRASDWTKIYNLYGGMDSEELISYGKGNRVDAFYYRFEDEFTDVKLTYNESNALKQTVKEQGYVGNVLSHITTASYIYNEFNQVYQINCEVVDKYEEEIRPQWTQTVSISFSTLQNDELLSRMDYLDSQIASFTEWAVIEGI